MTTRNEMTYSLVASLRLEGILLNNSNNNKKLSSGHEIANVNFYDIVHALENIIDSCINSATDRLLQRTFTKFSEITQCNGHYAVQGHLRSPILVPIECIYDFLLVTNTNLLPALHRFQVMADYPSYFR